MKKKKITGIILALFTLCITANVNAEEQTSDFIDLSKLCVVKEENKMAVKFELKKDLCSVQNDAIRIQIKGENNEIFAGNSTGGYCEGAGCSSTPMQIVPNTTTCTATKVEGTTIQDTKLTSGMTIAQYYEMQNESFTTTDILVEIYLQGANYDYETIVYNTKENKVESVEKGHDFTSELINTIETKYPEWPIGAGETNEDYILFIAVQYLENEEVGMTKTIEIQNWQQKTLEEMMEEVDAVFGNKEIEVSVGENSQINNKTLEIIKQNGYIASINGYSNDEERNVLYMWTFDGSKIERTDLNIDLNVKIGESTNKEKIENLVEKEQKALVIEFGHHGELPKGTQVKVNVNKTFENGKQVSLYYYNDKGELEEVAKNLEVKEGYVEFSLEHCSEYVLVEEKEKSNNAQTGTLNIPFYSTLAVASILGITYLIIKKKKSC